MKKLLALVLTMVMLLTASPVMAMENTSDESIDKVLSAYNHTLEMAYFGQYLPVEAALVSDDALLHQLNARNSFLVSQQALYLTSNQHFDFKIVARHILGTQALVIGERTLHYDNTSKANQQQFPTMIHEKEGYVLIQKDGQWLLDRVIASEDTNAPNLVKLEKALKDGVLYPKGSQRQQDIIDDFSGRDYLAELARIQTATKSDQALTVTWNGEVISFPDQQPFIANDRVMIPVRFLVEKLPGYGIVRASDTAQVYTIQPVPNSDSHQPSLKLTIGSSDYLYQDGKGLSETRSLYQPLQVVNGRMVMSARNIGELFGEVQWNARTRTVNIVADGKDLR